MPRDSCVGIFDLVGSGLADGPVGRADDGTRPRVTTPSPGPKSRALLERASSRFYPGLAHSLAPFVVSRKWDWWVEDVDGNVYLDFLSASASVPFGAAADWIVGPAAAALQRYGNEDSHYLTTEPAIELAEQLLAIAPPGIKRVDIALNGTEAVEIAVKFMRRATGRPIILAFMGGFHGESTTTATLGAEAAEIARGIRHLSPGFIHVPYPNPYRTPFASPRPGGTGDATIDYIRDYLLFHVVDPGDIAGVLIEPILGSGGVITPPPIFWAGLDGLRREFDWLLCIDEVKTGFGRAGEVFASTRYGLEPDLICLGKAMGGGVMPIGAVIGTNRAMGWFDDVPTGSTLAWLPAAAVAAIETIRVFDDPDTLEHVRAIERVALSRLRPLLDRHEQVGDVRAVGAFIAIEFVTDRLSKTRARAIQEQVAAACLQRGVLGDPSTTSLNLQPSLVVPIPVLEHGLDLVVEAIDHVLS